MLNSGNNNTTKFILTPVGEEQIFTVKQKLLHSLLKHILIASRACVCPSSQSSTEGLKGMCPGGLARIPCDNMGGQGELSVELLSSLLVYS